MARFKAKCSGCEYESEYSYIRQDTAQWMAETHMMQTGHPADVIEVS